MEGEQAPVTELHDLYEQHDKLSAELLALPAEERRAMFTQNETTKAKNLRRGLTNLASRITDMERNFADDL